MEINKEFLGKLFEQAVENPRLRQSYDLRGFLSMFEFWHEQAVGTSLCHSQYGVIVLVHDEVHFPVTKSFAVSFCRPFMDADAVTYVGSLRFLSFPGFSCIFHLVAAVSCKFSRLIITYEFVDGLVGYAYAFYSQEAWDLFGRPLLVLDQLLYLPTHFGFDGAITRSATFFTFCALVCLCPNVFAVLGWITLDFSADSWFWYFYCLRNGLVRLVLLYSQMDCVSLLTG